jgi:predicted ATPase
MLVDSVPELRALLVFTYRPEYARSFGERTYVSRLVPSALSSDESARMVAALLATDALPDELRGLVGTKAEGNPFYVEELVKSLEESGALRRVGTRYELARAIGEIAVPGTVQDVIAARIDRLAEAPKRTLQLAAVIGREFTRRLVDRLGEIRERTDGFLRELTALELIHERRLYPELAYMFKHALTQDVAYASLLVQRRRELHGLVGLAIEELYADRLPEHYEMLAHHFSLAEDWERALEYLLKAAEKASQAFGLRQALELYGNALEATRRLGDRVPVATLTAILRARADLFLAVGDFGRSREAAEALVHLARRVEDRLLEADALTQLASASQWLEDFPSALQRAQEAIEITEAHGATRLFAGALLVRSYVLAVSGKLDVSEAGFTRVLEIVRAQGDRSREALALHNLATQRSWQGQYSDSLELSREGTRLGREGRFVIALLRNLWTQGLALTDRGTTTRRWRS